MSTAVGFIQEARAKLRSFTRREEQLASIESTLCKAERVLDCEGGLGEEQEWDRN